MTEFFDTSQVRDASAHWDALADQIAAHAARHASGNAVEWLARSRVALIAASLFLTVGLAAIVVPVSASKNAGAIRRTEILVPGLVPTDDVGRAMMLRDRPPTMERLLFGDRGGT